MGCVSCSEVCGSQKDVNKNNSQFLKKTQNKLSFIKKTYSSPEQKQYLQQFISQQEGHILMHLLSLEQRLKIQNILLPQAGQLCYLNPIRRTVWKLYIFDFQVYQYHKNGITHKFTENINQIKLSQKVEQRFYQIGLDINRTFPLIKHLNRSHLQLVLKNLTLYFDGVGYTQGMNFIIGFLLLCGFQPRQTYYFFIHLSHNNNFLTIRNFSQGFKNVFFMIKMFQQEMDKKQILKNVKQKIEQMGLTSFFYSFSWFLCYFLYNLNPKCCVIIWDYLFTFVIQDRKQSKKQQSNKTKIKQLNEIETFFLEKQKNSPQYYQIILKQRGSVINLLFLAFQLLQYLSSEIQQCQSAQQLMKILRNQNLAQRITPQIIQQLINKITDKNKQQYFHDINFTKLIGQTKNHDKQLFEIEINEMKKKQFVQQCLGLRRKYTNYKKQEIVNKDQNKIQNNNSSIKYNSKRDKLPKIQKQCHIRSQDYIKGLESNNNISSIRIQVKQKQQIKEQQDNFQQQIKKQ